MMKKGLAFIAFFSVFLLSACNHGDELSGKTFNLAYTPLMEEELDQPAKYDSVMSLQFSKDNEVTNMTDDTKGTYELKGDSLDVHFENENEKLEINFIDFKESEKDFSKYSTLISRSQVQLEDADQVSQFQVLDDKLIKNHPIEFIEK